MNKHRSPIFYEQIELLQVNRIYDFKKIIGGQNEK